MADPVGIAIGLLGIIGPAVQTGRQAWEFWRQTQGFGEDYRTAQRKLERQIVLLEIRESELSALVSHSSASATSLRNPPCQSSCLLLYQSQSNLSTSLEEIMINGNFLACEIRGQHPSASSDHRVSGHERLF